MCNCEWDAKELLEDIRETQCILLWDRRGLTMITSTLYKMKGMTIKMIQGNYGSYTNLLT